MSYVNRIVALVLGVVLYTASVYVLRSIPIQFDYFQFPARELFADTVINGAKNTFPFFVLSLALSWIALRWLTRPPRIAVWWLIGGLIVGFSGWEVVSGVQGYYSCVDWHSVYEADNRGEPWFRSLPACSILTLLRETFFWDVQNFFAILAGLATAASLLLRYERIAVPEKGIMNAREAILVTAVAFVCGLLGGSIWASSAKSDEVTVDARNSDEWTSTRLKVRGGELIQVYANGTLRVNRGDAPSVQRVYPRGMRDGLGRLDMRFGNLDAVQAFNPGYGQWIGYAHAPGTIQFHIRGGKNEMSGQYRVRVVVLPTFRE
jgi:hypothetical protein